MSEEKTKKTTKNLVEKNKEIREETIIPDDNPEKTKQDVVDVSSLDEEKRDISSAESTEKSKENVVSEEITLETMEKDVEQIDNKKVDKDILKEKTDTKQEEYFDWDNLEISEYNEKERSDLESEYLPTLHTIKNKKVLDGTVVRVTDKEVIVDINFKSDGVINRAEFRYNSELKSGDIVEVLVEKQEDKNGQLILSHRRARVLRAWEKVNIAQETGEIIEGKIQSRTKGGMIVEVLGIEAFLPGSQIDVKPIRDYDEYVGKKMEFKVLKVNEAFRNIVVSHKALIEEDIEEQKKEIMSKLEKGQVLEGVVKNTTSYGVFIDLGGVDGLIHITDLSWGRISHPDEIVTLDEKINVVILDFDEEKRRIQLGLKQLSKHPWDSLEIDLSVGDKIKGKVVVVADYGVFIEIQPGIEALLHVSEMSWSTHLRSANDFFKVGDEVEAQILTLDKKDRKMSLGIKQMQEDPWSSISTRFPVGSTQNVKVINFTNFGIFVELDEGIDGLIHISDLSWTRKIKHPAEFTNIDEMLDVVVLEINIENRRISLGHKQIEDNPWDTYETLFIVGNIYKGTIKEMYDKGVIVVLEHNVEAFAPIRHIEKESGNNAGVGESLDFKILEFSKENKKILLSHTLTFKEEKDKIQKKKTTKKIKEKIQLKQQNSTLGDLEVLSELKGDMKKNKKDEASEK